MEKKTLSAILLNFFHSNLEKELISKKILKKKEIVKNKIKHCRMH
jgi:hypothetical protein